MMSHKRKSDSGQQSDTVTVKRLKGSNDSQVSDVVAWDQQKGSLFISLLKVFPPFFTKELLPILVIPTIKALRLTCKELYKRINNPHILPVTLFIKAMRLHVRRVMDPYTGNVIIGAWRTPKEICVNSKHDLQQLYNMSHTEKIRLLASVHRFAIDSSVRDDKRSSKGGGVMHPDVYQSVLDYSSTDNGFYYHHIDDETKTMNLCQWPFSRKDPLAMAGIKTMCLNGISIEVSCLSLFPPALEDLRVTLLMNHPVDTSSATDQLIQHLTSVGPISIDTLSSIKAARSGGTLKRLQITIAGLDCGQDRVQIINLPDSSPIETLDITAFSVLLPKQFPLYLKNLILMSEEVYVPLSNNERFMVSRDTLTMGRSLECFKDLENLELGCSVIAILNPNDVDPIKQAFGRSWTVTPTSFLFNESIGEPLSKVSQGMRALDFKVICQNDFDLLDTRFDLSTSKRVENEGLPVRPFVIPESVTSLNLLIRKDFFSEESITPDHCSIEEWVRSSVPGSIVNLSLSSNIPISMESFPCFKRLTGLGISKFVLPTKGERSNHAGRMKLLLPSLKMLGVAISLSSDDEVLDLEGLLPTTVKQVKITLHRSREIGSEYTPIHVTFKSIPKHIVYLNIYACVDEYSSGDDILDIDHKPIVIIHFPCLSHSNTDDHHPCDHVRFILTEDCIKLGGEICNNVTHSHDIWVDDRLWLC